jgi:hypothetical protein
MEGILMMTAPVKGWTSQKGIQTDRKTSRSVPSVEQKEGHQYQWEFTYMWTEKKSRKHV